MTHAIEIRDFGKRYGARSVFAGFNLDVEPGETLAILGASGCGKSTLLRAMAGLLQPDGGTIAIRDEVGLVFQEPRLLPWLNVERNVAFAARSDVERARVNEVLALVGLSSAAHLLPKELSGGMAQRAALARTLVRSPRILLLDEPLSALDALLRMELQTALAAIVAETASTAILVTHDVEEALYLADRIVVLAGTPAQSRLALTVPHGMRRSRTADATDERVALLAALGIEARAPKRSHRGLRVVAP
jgi:ABC-type nitrate/sulfonate/bicarbonate transport system ATPase subunit